MFGPACENQPGMMLALKTAMSNEWEERLIKQILVVEDNQIFQKNLTKSLRSNQFEVRNAASGKDALEMLNAYDVQMILLDIGLPDYNGLDLLEEIRKSHPQIPVVIMTADASPENERRAKGLGVAAFFTKPVHLRMLRETISAFQSNVGGQPDGR